MIYGDWWVFLHNHLFPREMLQRINPGLLCILMNPHDILYRAVEMNTDRGTIEIRNPKGVAGEQPKQFTFDAVYDWK